MNKGLKTLIDRYLQKKRLRSCNEVEIFRASANFSSASSANCEHLTKNYHLSSIIYLPRKGERNFFNRGECGKDFADILESSSTNLHASIVIIIFSKEFTYDPKVKWMYFIQDIPSSPSIILCKPVSVILGHLSQ